jgi:hypothetical protein
MRFACPEPAPYDMRPRPEQQSAVTLPEESKEQPLSCSAVSNEEPPTLQNQITTNRVVTEGTALLD